MNIYIDWVRHAESCANLMGNHINDKYKDEQLNHKLRNNVEGLIKSFTETINTHAAYKTEINKNSNANIESLFHPTLSNVGIQQAIKLGLTYIRSKKYDMILTSATVRTLMTSMLSLDSSKIQNIIVVPYINEITDSDTDRSNMGLNPNVIDNIINILKKWLYDNKFIHSQENFVIYTDFYKDICHNRPNESPRFYNLDKFRNIISELLIMKQINKHDVHIIVYAHGRIIKELLHKYSIIDDFPINAAVYEENYNSETFKKVHNNTNVRDDSFVDNLEESICDIGKQDKLMSIINMTILYHEHLSDNIHKLMKYKIKNFNHQSDTFDQ